MQEKIGTVKYYRFYYLNNYSLGVFCCHQITK